MNKVYTTVSGQSIVNNLIIERMFLFPVTFYPHARSLLAEFHEQMIACLPRALLQR